MIGVSQAMPRSSSVIAEARYRLRYDLAREPVLVSFVDLALPRRGSRLPYGGALTGCCGRSRSGAVKAQPETLTANAESARWRSNLYCAVRSATRVVPHHAFHERDRGPGCRPVGIIDKAVDSNVRARPNIECGTIDELEICASLFVGVHRSFCATGAPTVVGA